MMTLTLRSCLLLLLLNVANAQVFPALYAYIPADAHLERDLLNLTNDERRRTGLGTLVPDEALALAARHHAQEMRDLNFFSHSSPTLANATLGKRVAQAGSAALSVGENLALVGAQESAQRSVQGWMESPGHRRNLLEPSFTHVGFGAARDANGRVFVAQVLAAQPVEVQRAQVTSRLQESYRVEVTLTLPQTQEVALFHGTTLSRKEVLGAGRHALSFTVDKAIDNAGASPLHLRVGVRGRSGTGDFILHDDGWLNADGRWRPSGSAPRDLARIEGVSRRLQISRVYRADFTFAEPPRETLGAWLNGDYVEPEVYGRTLSVAFPSTLERPTLSLGTRTQGERYTLLYRVQLDLVGGAPRLAPVASD